MQGLAPPVELLDAQTGNGRTLVLHEQCLLFQGEALAEVGSALTGREMGILIARTHLITQQLEHRLAIAAPQLAIARHVEVQLVGQVGTACRGDDVGSRNGLGQGVDLTVHGDTLPLAVRLHHLAYQQGHLRGLEVQVAQQALIDALHLACPSGLARIRLSLMHQYSLDDSILLCPPGQRQQPLIGIVVVGLQHAFHPVGSFFGIGSNLVGHEALDTDAPDGDMNYSHPDMLGQRLDERASEPVGRRQSRVGTAQGGSGLAPLTFSPAPLRIVDGRHEKKTGSRSRYILCFRLGSPLHVRLSETQEDIEIWINSGIRSKEPGGQQHP